MKKICILLTGILLFLFGINSVQADGTYCTREDAEQLAKIVYKETGASTASPKEETFFMRASTAAVVINNASGKKGDTFYQKLYNLTDSNYSKYSTYKDKSFEEVVPEERRGEFLYIAELVLTGKYTFPSNMKLQAVESIVTKYGTVWTSIKTNHWEVFFGYSGDPLKDTDAFGNKLSSTSPEYYKNLAKSLEKSSYSAYTSSTVCTGITKPNTAPGSGTNNKVNNTSTSGAADACANPEVLKVVYFAMLIGDILKITLPIVLIVVATIGFSKSIIISDEKVQKKSVGLFAKRILYAILIFALPWLIEVLMITLGDLIGEDGMINFTDCLENANSECIAALESGISANIKSICDKDTNVCHQCNGNPYLFEWSSNPDKSQCPSGWHTIDRTKDNCK